MCRMHTTPIPLQPYLQCILNLFQNLLDYFVNCIALVYNPLDSNLDDVKSLIYVHVEIIQPALLPSFTVSSSSASIGFSSSVRILKCDIRIYHLILPTVQNTSASALYRNDLVHVLNISLINMFLTNSRSDGDTQRCLGISNTFLWTYDSTHNRGCVYGERGEL